MAKYYGMTELMCKFWHWRQWLPFMGQYWCPVCEKLRKDD